MNITILGAHNIETQNSKFVSILIDHTIAIDAGGLTASLSLSEQLKLEIILLSHQHYDHIRDIPALAMNFFLNSSTIRIYSTQPVFDILKTHLLNGDLYPKFMEQPEPESTINFIILEPNQPELLNGYTINTVPVKHTRPGVGYEITSPDNKTMFFTGDTGTGLRESWATIAPQLLIIELTAPNRYTDWAIQAHHLTPKLLHQELTLFRDMKGYLPQILTIHMNPMMEKEIESELKVLADKLSTSITLATEGIQINL